MSDLELLRLTRELARRSKESVAEKYTPWPKQKEFLDSTHDIKAFVAGNRCLGGEVEVYDPVIGAKRRMDQIDEDFHIYAWDGEKRVVARALRPHMNEKQNLYRVEFEDGSEIVCTDNHLFMTANGWQPLASFFGEPHPESAVCLLPSTLDSDQLTRASSVEHSIQKALDSPENCSVYRHPCGEQLRSEAVGVQDAVPSLDDAPQHRPECDFPPCAEQMDGLGSKSGHNHQHPECVHPSSLDGLDLISARFSLGESQSQNIVHLPVSDSIRVLSQHHCSASQNQPESECDPQVHGVPGLSDEQLSSGVQSGSGDGHNERQERVVEYQAPDSPRSEAYRPHTVVCEGDQYPRDILPSEIRCVSSAFVVTSKLRIRRISFLRNDFVWDFEVYEHNNYFINDVLCHNCGKTLTVAYEINCHLTGDYPPWWKGLRYTSPITVWAAGVTWIRVRDTIQVKLLGQLGKPGTGMIPKEKIGESIKKSGIPYAVDQVQIKHISGEWSTLQFFSYEMSREQFQGSSVQIVWFDEEPPEEIYNECKMRVLDCRGSIFFSFTPLSGVTPLYDEIMRSDKIHKVHMSMDEAGHLDKDAIERLLDGMSDYEKKARREGIASVGSGKVFQFPEDDYTIEPFEIPHHWPRLGGLDVGLTHPTGALCGVKDPESQTYYIINEYKASNKTPIEHCAHLKHWGIKFAIDPSAFNRQIGTMSSVASMYEDEGLELVKADNAVDKSIMEIRKMIGAGRLYIFTTCQELLKEMRTYRTNDKGNIIKVDDDLIDPMRYLLLGIDEHGEVMKRYKEVSSIKRFKPADAKVGY